MTKKTGAFEPVDERAVNETIKMLFERVLHWSCGNHADLTVEDLEELFLPAEHRQLAHDATKVLAIAPMHRFTVKMPGSVQIDTPYGFLKWYYPKGYVNKECAGYQKLKDWYDRRIEIGTQWGLVQEVFEELHFRLRRTDHVRYYWPSIVPLLGTRPIAQRLADWKPGVNPDPIPPKLRVACATTMATVSTALLAPPVPASASPTPNITVLIVEHYSLPKVLKPWAHHPVDDEGEPVANHQYTHDDFYVVL